MNDQERLWAGEFGEHYHGRRHRDVREASNFLALAARGLDESVWNVDSAIEFGAGTGTNLKALRELIPRGELLGVEINKAAAEAVRAAGFECYNTSILQWSKLRQWDLVISKGLLIHIAPADIQKALETLYNASRKWILVAEYFSPRLESVPYRGHEAAMWRGPYAYMMLDRWKDLSVWDYGFVSSRDNEMFQEDDITWFLLRKE